MSMNPQQPTVLTSWKEIAAYLGKGVRTVQRWERQLGLPVRRPGLARHVVIGVPSELDVWVSRLRVSTGDACCDSRAELERAKESISELREENAQLRSRIAQMEATPFRPTRADTITMEKPSTLHSDERGRSRHSHQKHRMSA